MSAAPVHWSFLRHMGRSPAHYRQALIHGVPVTAAMRFGALVHRLVLGGHREFLCYDGTRRGKAWEEFRDSHQGSTIVTADEWERAEAVAAAVKSNPLAGPLLSGIKEGTISWNIAGRACQGSPDLLGVDLVDLKTTTNASPGWFTYHAQKMGYLAQLAWYADGCEAAGLGRRQRVLIIAQEVAPPYCTTPFELQPNALDAGRRHYRLLFERLLVCEATGEWPGYVQEIVPLDVPEDLTLEIAGEPLTIGEEA